jgi:hypothetical protein
MKFEKLAAKVFTPIKREDLLKIKGGADSFTKTANRKTKLEDSTHESD